jgi:hypothetical protein
LALRKSLERLLKLAPRRTRDEFKKIEPYFTGRSFTYRIEVVGFFGEAVPRPGSKRPWR